MPYIIIEIDLQPTKDVKLPGLMLNGKLYVDMAVQFGYRHGSLCIHRNTDPNQYIMHRHVFFMFYYINDRIGCIHISQQMSVSCLGILVNIMNGTISIPLDKMRKTVCHMGV